MPRPLRSITVLAPLAALTLACSSGDGPSGGAGPVAVSMQSPTPGTLYSAGDTISVSLSGTSNGAAVAASALSHWVVFHHATHTHPFLGAVDGASGRVVIPREGHTETDVYYRVYARALDASGRADTAYVDLMPRLTNLTFITEPAGLQVTLDGQPRMTPLTVPSVVGVHRMVGVPASQTVGTNAFGFFAWSNGATETQTLTTPGTPLTLTATLTAVGGANAAPIVVLAAPAANTVLTTGMPVTLSATASDADGSIARVQFFEGATLLAQDLVAPFTHEWTPTGTGPRVLRARATDDAGKITASGAVPVMVQAAGTGDVTAPVATFVAPSAGTRDLTGAIVMSATATDDVGVVSMDFEIDGEPLATDATAPFSATLASTAPYTSGAHVLRARARDAAGNVSPWASSLVEFGGDVDLPAGFVRAPFVTGFGAILTSIAIAPDGRMFATEQTGALRVVKGGALLAAPFVSLPVLSEGERGLLGVALDPAFATNGFVYVYYTTAAGGAHNRISRFTAAGDVAAAGSEVVLADLPALSGATNHNGGAMAFGPDGKLYVAVGDNANGALAPLLTSPFGKMLRFNPDGSIPGDNPFFAQTTGVNRAIWARGLRNPYTFAFQPGTGRMHINDVGENSWEEINLGRAGAHYGWPLTEGPTDDPAYDEPILAYGHDQSPTLFSGFSIVGAAFYNPATASFGSAYVGDFFFADYVSGWIHRLDVANGNAAYAFARTSGNPVNLIVGSDGVLYVLIDGRIDRISRQ